MIDIKLFDEIGLYDETLTWGEDTDWMFRLKFARVDMEHRIDEVLYLRRVHKSNVSTTREIIYRKDIRKLTIDAYRKVKRLKK